MLYRPEANDQACGGAGRAPSATLKRNWLRIVLIATCFLLAPAGLAAQTLDLGNGLVLDDGEIRPDAIIAQAHARRRHFCMVIVGSPGALAPAIGNVALSSKVAGGIPGSAQIIASKSRFRARIGAPLSFSASPNLKGAVTFDAEFSGTGASNFSARPSAKSVRIRRGLTNIRADLTARIHGASFVAGEYRAELTLRCE